MPSSIPAPPARGCLGNVARFPRMIEGGLQDGQHPVCGGAALADTIWTLVRLTLVRLAAGRRSQQGGLLGQPMMPVLKPLSRQSRDRKRSERWQDMCLGSPSGR
jgi:hypothetical protein